MAYDRYQVMTFWMMGLAAHMTGIRAQVTGSPNSLSAITSFESLITFDNARNALTQRNLPRVTVN